MKVLSPPSKPDTAKRSSAKSAKMSQVDDASRGRGNYPCWYCSAVFTEEGIRNTHVKLNHDPDNIAYSEFGPK